MLLDETLDELLQSVCDYCGDDTEEETLACISYDSSCKDQGWYALPAWIKKPLACDNVVHLSCARKNDAYNGDTEACKAAYPEIGFCKGCLKDVENARFDQ